jgi:hypothetical protein
MLWNDQASPPIAWRLIQHRMCHGGSSFLSLAMLCDKCCDSIHEQRSLGSVRHGFYGHHQGFESLARSCATGCAICVQVNEEIYRIERATSLSVGEDCQESQKRKPVFGPEYDDFSPFERPFLPRLGSPQDEDAYQP